MKMKFLALLSALVFCALATPAKAQGIIKLNPIGLAFGSLNAGYETFLNDKSSVYVGASFYSRNLIGIKYSGLGLDGQFRFYLSNNDRPKGLYVAPAASVGFIGFKDNSDKFNYTLIRLGAIIGYQWVFSQKFTVEVGIGPSYGLITGNYEDSVDVFGDGVLPIGILSLGYIIK
ncbi:MAG TPA: DUF3575 domain-containing protein [Flavilitoribacter sp.]|nr:DUF3575 domain-containing protein [Lewinella sp.]MCB9281286.1 DUF3575 domain-containing protein [Lewinellaceae bacterium]HMQ62763.1 DUF3575 domain-containing protein [Flavilitoribacter sp.]